MQAHVHELDSRNETEHVSLRKAIDALRDLMNGRLESVKDLMNTRIPIWTTFLIGGLMSLSTGLAVALLR